MPIYRLRGRTLGIIGFGKIGQSLAEKARTLGLDIIAYDPYLSDEAIKQRGVEPKSLDNLLAQADFVSLHTPLTPETRGLLNADRLRKMKPTGFVINTARGGLIVTDALTQALQEGWIAGAALDVFDPEPFAADHPLLSQPTLIATPHIAFYSEESVLELEVQAARNVAAILSGRRPASVVNPEVLALPRWEHLH
jgi:D-3-phosphoglycerate dehydrogenase